MLGKIEQCGAMRKLEKKANLSAFNGGYSPPTPHSFPGELNKKFRLVFFIKGVHSYHRISLLYAKNAKEAIVRWLKNDCLNDTCFRGHVKIGISARF